MGLGAGELRVLAAWAHANHARNAQAGRRWRHERLLRVQARWRGWLCRRRFLQLRAAAVGVQRCVRRFLQARAARRLAALRHCEHQRLYFAGFALRIQRVFRGHRARQTVHDFHARKLYLQAVRRREEEVLRLMAAHAAEDARTQGEERARRAEEAARRTALGSHHLLSTACAAGALKETSEPFVRRVCAEERAQRRRAPPPLAP